MGKKYIEQSQKMIKKETSPFEKFQNFSGNILMFKYHNVSERTSCVLT